MQSQLGQGQFGEDQGEFKLPLSIAIDTHDKLYIADVYNHRIQRFTTDGDYDNQWGEAGDKKCQFDKPISVSTDNLGHIYVYDSDNTRIQKFQPDEDDEDQCHFMTQWGEKGSFPGQFYNMGGITVEPDAEQVYLADTKFNRVQVFKKAIFNGGKAIIVAGGDSNTRLWDIIEAGAKFAYRTLTYQGFTKDSLYYLSHDPKSDDLDNNGQFDDIDAENTKDNVKKAITEWAADTTHLTIYLIGSGDSETFYLKSNREKDKSKSVVTAEELSQWLDILQQKHPNGIATLIYEACNSGSFIPKLSRDKSKKRIIMTSAKAEEDAFFIAQGALSFSNSFWNSIFNGLNIEEAFFQAKEKVIESEWMKQTPQLETNISNLHQRYIANNTEILGNSAPVITSSLITMNDDKTVSITAQVKDEEGDRIARVWAVLIYENPQMEATGQPITVLPSCELEPTAKPGYFESTQCTLEREGDYEVAIYALDAVNNVSKPVVKNLSLGQGFKHKAVIIAGGSEKTHVHYPQFVQNAAQVYNTLRYQGYKPDDIYYMANVSTDEIETKTADLFNVEGALSNWIEDNTGELVIYLVGLGDQKSFALNETESLGFEQLKKELDTLQQRISGRVIVVYEGRHSGNMLPALKKPPVGKERIVISSTGINDEGYQLEAFSHLFWPAILKGINVFEAFGRSKRALSESSQIPQLDDNGDGIYGHDGQIARYHIIGIGIGRAGLPQELNVHNSVQVRYQDDRLQVLLPTLLTDEVYYFGVQLPEGDLLMLTEALKSDQGGLQGSFVAFQGIETMPIWEGKDEMAIDIKIEATIPRGKYRFYWYRHKRGTPLDELSFNPQQLSQTFFYLRR